MPSGLETVENHNLEDENDTLKFNKLSITITKNQKNINSFSYVKINIYKEAINTFMYKRDDPFKS